MEIKVIVNGQERCVSGVTEATTCAQIIYAIANAIDLKGHLFLTEKIGETVSFL